MSVSRTVPFLLLALVPVACGPAPAVPVYPVSGEVFVNGEPAAGATIMFYPVGAKDAKADDPKDRPYNPTATVADDGSFRLTTFTANDGAPPGDYQVTIVWAESYRDEGETKLLADKLRGRYRNPATSRLTATVNEGKTVVPRFALDGK